MSLTFNGMEAYDNLGLEITGVTGLLGAPAKALGLLDVPQLAGVIDSGVTPHESARVLRITGLVKAASVTALTTTLDTLKEALGTGLVTITSTFSASRAYYGTIVTCGADPIMPLLVNGVANVLIEFLCPIPYAIATSPTVVAFGSTLTDLPLGTAPSTLRDQWSAIVEIVGAATTPTVTYVDAAGVSVGTMVTSLSPVAGDSTVADCGRRIFYKFVSGVRSNAISTLTAGYKFPAFDPGDGYASGASYPKIKTSSGSGFARYYKAWK